MFMNTKITVCLFIFLTFISSCTDTATSSPYDKILHQTPFASLTDSIEKNPANDELYFRRAILLNTSNLTEPALEDFKKAWSLQKTEQYALGISTLLQENKPAEAISFLNDAIKEVPNSLLLSLSLARGYEATGKTDEALALCNSILVQNPKQVDLLKMKANLLDKKNKTAESIATLEKAYTIAPYDVELIYMLAIRYAETKNQKVIALCDSLIKLDQTGEHAEPYYYKGVYYSTIGEKNKAIAMFDEGIKHNYTFLENYIEKGSALYELKKYTEALSVFNLALTVSPKFADNYYWIAKCEEATGKKEEAKLNYQRALNLDNTIQEAKEGLERLSK